MNVNLPPGMPLMAAASDCENPDCVIAHAIAVAAPTTIRIAPDRDADWMSTRPS